MWLHLLCVAICAEGGNSPPSLAHRAKVRDRCVKARSVDGAEPMCGGEEYEDSRAGQHMRSLARCLRILRGHGILHIGKSAGDGNCGSPATRRQAPRGQTPRRAI